MVAAAVFKVNGESGWFDDGDFGVIRECGS